MFNFKKSKAIYLVAFILFCSIFGENNCLGSDCDEEETKIVKETIDEDIPLLASADGADKIAHIISSEPGEPSDGFLQEESSPKEEEESSVSEFELNNVTADEEDLINQFSSFLSDDDE
jgi:hypothetical protein